MSSPNTLALTASTFDLQCRIRWFLFGMCPRSSNLQTCLPRHILELSKVFFSPNSMLLIHHEFEGVLDVNGCNPKGLYVNVYVHIYLPIGPIQSELPFTKYS